MEKLTPKTEFVDPARLDQIREAVDWDAVVKALGIQLDTKRSTADDWWAHSPFSEDETASFHIKPKRGVWYCFSTKQGGGVIELVQRIQDINCYAAGRWIVSQGLCQLADDHDEKSRRNRGTVKRRKPLQSNSEKLISAATENPNQPIRQSLIDGFTEQGDHPQFTMRGIDKSTCEYLGCGFLPKGRSALKGRIVFQVRSLEEKNNQLTPTILTHIGRATDDEQASDKGKWLFYAGFQKRFELYNIDKLLTDPEAIAQVQMSGLVIIVEGPFDVAKLIQAGIKNVVGILGSGVARQTQPRFELIQKHANPKNFLLWFDRDKAGKTGQEKGLNTLREIGLESTGFDWDRRFGNSNKEICIPKAINDPCDMSIDQLRWLRTSGLI